MSNPTEAGPTPLSTFRVEGMTCQNCARHAREAAEGVPGVSRATVDLGRGRLTLRWEASGQRDESAVAEAVGKAGFPTTPVPATADGSEAEAEKPVSAGQGWWRNVILGGAVTLFLMVAEWGLGWAHESWFGWVAFAVALPVQVICGARFYRGAWAQLRRGGSSMDTLVSLGSTAAFGFSVWVVFRGAGGHVYFMESSAIITLISVGHWLEALATERAAGAIRALVGLAPSTARRLGSDGVESSIAVSALLPGDRIVLVPGERVPTDGEVVEGGSAVDEAMLTGEAKPVEKSAGSKVFAGTSNVDGRLVVRVESTGESTALAQIIAAVERAQNSRAGIQRLADSVSAVFVPVVIVMAVLTGLLWGLAPEHAAAMHAWAGRFLWSMHLPESPLAAAVIHATSVLIVACPCAMGLATPAAIMAGANAAALRGILIRDGVALEKAGRIDTVVFDKTGTLTEGGLKVCGVRDLRPETERRETLESLASGVARGSQHPVAKALAGLGKAKTTENEAVVGSHLFETDLLTDHEPGIPGGETPPSTAGETPAATDTRFRGRTKLLPRLPGASVAGAASMKPGAPVGGVVGLRRDLAFLPRRSSAGVWGDWREIRGSGVEARRSGEEQVVYRLGSLGWLETCGVVGAAGMAGEDRMTGAVVTRVGLSMGVRLLGVVDLQDTLRPEARAVVAALHRDGHAVYLLSGDGWPAAEAAAKEVGIPPGHVMASVKPEEKAKAIQRLQGEGRRVAFVGDGLNDGPALAQADLGIAVSRATDVARESADVVLIRPGLERLLEALGLAQATLRTIRQNLFWAFFYNAAAVPLAMLGFFSPVVCAAAMGLSDLLVIGNAMRLRFWSLRSRAVNRPEP
jgi:Cu+-exporting ATPase